MAALAGAPAVEACAAADAADAELGWAVEPGWPVIPLPLSDLESAVAIGAVWPKAETATLVVASVKAVAFAAASGAENWAAIAAGGAVKDAAA